MNTSELQYEMSNLDPIQDMPTCLLADLVLKYADLYQKMYEIDPVETVKNIRTFVNHLIDILNFRIAYWTYDEESLVGFYDNYVASVITPRFAAFYDTTHYSTTLKQRTFDMICSACRDSLSPKTLNAKLSLLKRIDKFDKDSLECVFATITQNFRESDTIDFRGTNVSINRLIETFDDCVKKGVNLSRVLRFLVINQLHSEMTHSEPNYHYIKHLLYVQSGELIISNYLFKLVQTEFTMKPSFDAILCGIPENRKLTGLDEYYVKYEISHCPWNFKM